MKKFIGFLAFVLVLCGAMGFLIFPNPLTDAGFTPRAWQKINQHFETEILATTIPETKTAISLDWFMAVDSIFQPFTDTQIFDLRTQRFFTVQRTGGQGHADVETINAYHTQIFGDIVQTFPKARLPVLVEINDMWVAASLSTNPHGFSMIGTNNLGGHLCLHFEGSITDGTKRPDLLAQKTIKQALKMANKIFPNK